MSHKFLIFQKFQNLEQAQFLLELLKLNEIEYQSDETAPFFDPSFANNPISNLYIVKLRKEDFEKANQLLEESTEVALASVSKDHFLYDFTDDELLEVVTKQDEWGSSNYLLAVKILRSKGKDIELDTLSEIRKNRIKELSKPEKPN